jgi:hypothetical protein
MPVTHHQHPLHHLPCCPCTALEPCFSTTAQGVAPNRSPPPRPRWRCLLPPPLLLPLPMPRGQWHVAGSRPRPSQQSGHLGPLTTSSLPCSHSQPQPPHPEQQLNAGLVHGAAAAAAVCQPRTSSWDAWLATALPAAPCAAASAANAAPAAVHPARPAPARLLPLPQKL